MMRKILPLVFALILIFGGQISAHQRDTLKYPDIYLDTVKIDKTLIINDYSMIGVEYGAGASRQLFSPVYNQDNRFRAGYYGVTYTKYGKMFGFMPYFGLQIGLFHGCEGYKMKANKDTGAISSIEGATEACYEVLEIPATAQFHYDMDHFKLLGALGIYGGHRYSIERIGDRVPEELVHSFLPTDRRLDYGLKGGLGFGLVFDPFEIHVKANIRYSWATLYDPDYKSDLYYYYAYPLDLDLSVGLFLQLGRRSGKDRATLRKEAKAIVYGEQL